MSTTNTEYLTLYANRYLYNGSRYVFYQGNNRADGLSYEQWLAQTSDEISEQMTVYYKSLTEDLELNSPVGDMVKFTYGKLTNDGYTYYIFIDRITTDQHGKSYISFSVDWWATSWNDIHPTKGHLTRKPTRPLYMAQPWTPLFVSYGSVPLGGNERGRKGCIMFTYIPSFGDQETNPSYISLGILELTEHNLALVQNGYWYQEYKIAGGDIKDCFIVPLIDVNDIANENNTVEVIYVNSDEGSGTVGEKLIDSFESRFPNFVPKEVFWYEGAVYERPPDDYPVVFDESDGKFKVIWWQEDVLYGTQWFSAERTVDYNNYEYRKAYINSYEEDGVAKYNGYVLSQNNDTVDTFSFDITGLTIYSDEQRTMGIQDWNGDSIWSCPYGMTVSSFRVRLLTGISHVMLEFLPQGSNKNGSKMAGNGFTYDCRHPGLFIDEYKEYVMRNRDYDIAMRSIQSDRQVWSAAASTLENIGFGYAFGDSATAHKGNSGGRPPYGAIAAGVGGVLETISTFVINKYFDPMIQQQYDNRYARMADQVALVGDSITNVMNERTNGLMQLYSLYMDTATQARMNTDIEVNGYVCDETTASVESLFTKGAILQADNVTVEGACCLDAKQQTVYRLQNGVEFK